MNTEQLSENYLFEKYRKDVVKRWITSLKYGYFKRACGGFANDGDEFGIWLSYQNQSELFKILNAFGIKLNKIPKNQPKPIIGKPYRFVEYKKFKSEIKDYPEFEQPLHVEIRSIPCFVWIENGKISIIFSGSKADNQYEVGEEDFENCLKIEKIITEMDLIKYVNTDYENLDAYISQKKYPKLFE